MNQHQNDVRVAVQIAGGLGNQLFQYAAGRALAQRLGAQLVLDCTPRMANPRTFALDRFPIKAQVIRNAPVTIRPRYFRLGGNFGRRVTDLFHNAFPRTVQIDGHCYKIVYEKRIFTYDSHFEALTGSSYLTGWRQSYRYFENAADSIRSDLQMAWAPSRANSHWVNRIQQARSVCLHIRRGDYLDPNVHDHFGICCPAYYERAVQVIRDRIDNPRFFVFSDDLAWCREHLSIADGEFVDSNGPEDAADELRLMAACRHHIIANSSFSWWAAWLAGHPEQIVIAPEPWFAGEPAAPDILPQQWMRLPQSGVSDASGLV